MGSPAVKPTPPNGRQKNNWPQLADVARFHAVCFLHRLSNRPMHLENRTPIPRHAPPAPRDATSAAMRCHPLAIFPMKKILSVAQLCAQAEKITGKAWSFKYELLHGKRFYFVYTTATLPFGQWHWSLVCRGNKDIVSAKILSILNNQP
jgi:hypothetical protein